MTQITTKPNDYVYNYVNQPQAATLSRGMYEGTPFESDLMNSYAWDTATLFLQTIDNRTTDKTTKYSRQTSLNTDSDGLASKGTNNLTEASKIDKICNVYDMASNCTEWSTETSSFDDSDLPCTLRGGDYYYSYYYTSFRDGVTTNGFIHRSFRPILYLGNSTLDSNGLDTITGNETENTTVQDSLGNQVVVPAGFEVVNPNDNVEDGIVVRDKTHTNTAGSEFVWIPVGDVKTKNKGTINIELNRYTFDSNGKETKQGTNKIDNYYTEDTAANHDNNYKNTIAKNIDDFKIKTKSSHGYYIGRYEARTATEREFPASLTQITTKPNEYIYNYISQPQAATLSREMYAGTTFESDLVNSYAWDTATLFFQTFGNNPKYSMQNSLNSSLANKGTNNLTEASKIDKICNVYDMASNCSEWTTETCEDSDDHLSGAQRGGLYLNNSWYMSNRKNMGPRLRRRDYFIPPNLILVELKK